MKIVIKNTFRTKRVIKSNLRLFFTCPSLCDLCLFFNHNITREDKLRLVLYDWCRVFLQHALKWIYIHLLSADTDAWQLPNFLFDIDALLDRKISMPLPTVTKLKAMVAADTSQGSNFAQSNWQSLQTVPKCFFNQLEQNFRWILGTNESHRTVNTESL